MRLANSWLVPALVATLVAVSTGGCSSEPVVETSQPIEMEGPPPEMEDAHAHQDMGPNGGQLIELGRSHEYHAEIVEDDEAGGVTVHILGRSMQPVPIEQSEITLSLLVDGTARSFTLQATDSAEGKASRFAAADREAYAALHAPEVTGKLLVPIAGKSYSGAVEAHGHDHDH